jgi:hypothetical protein
VSTPLVADDVNQAAICAGVDDGDDSRPRATIPATCGEAIDVPDFTDDAVEEPIHAEVMFDPGAKRSTHGPKFENDERASADVEDPTVIATASPAGDDKHAFELELPAATTNVTPSATPRCTAMSSEEDRPPPRLMFATAGDPATWWLTTQSMPAITPAVVPEPVQSSTRTGTTAALGATP